MSADALAVSNFVRSLNIALKSVRLYGLGHERTEAQCATAWEQLQVVLPRVAGKSIVLGVSDNKLLLDGEPLPDGMPERSFASLLSAAGLSSIDFFPHLTREEFDKFLQFCANSPPKASQAAGEAGAAPMFGAGDAIQLNRTRFVAEDSGHPEGRLAAELAGAALATEAGHLKDWIRDPGKLLQLIVAAKGARGGSQLGEATEQAGQSAGSGGGREGSAPGGAQPSPPKEEDISDILRILARLAESEGKAEGAWSVGQARQELARLPGSARSMLEQALRALAAKAPAQRPATPVLLQLAEDLAIRFAIEQCGREKSRTSPLYGVLHRMSAEVEKLRRLVPARPGQAEAGGGAAESAAEILDRKFWAAVPDASKRELLLSAEAGLVSAPNVRQFVQQLFDQGSADLAKTILLSYVGGLRNPDNEVRRRTLAGLTALTDLYDRAGTDLMTSVMLLLGEQLAAEADPHLAQQMSEVFVRFNDQALTSTPSAASLAIVCQRCKTQSLTLLASAGLSEALGHKKLKLFCPRCGSLTVWAPWEDDKRKETHGADGSATPDARSDQGRRRSRRVRVQIRLRVRWEEAGQSIIEVTWTTDVSRHGALFSSKHALEPGMEVLLMLPYTEGDRLPEKRAKVVRVTEGIEHREVAVQFLD